ncbi:MAG: hypothetical protein M3279_10805 [Actinomycetota bacterium]|nr:hypothetical protein [Actinomycetota bacterium]
MRSRTISFLGVAVLAAAAPPAASRPPGPTPMSPTVTIPAVPDAIEPLVAQQRRRGSNVMFAHLLTPPQKGYASSVVAYKASPSARTHLTIGFGRTVAEDTQTQTSLFNWVLPKGALRMDRDLRPASLVTRRSMGSNGSISMRLVRPGRFGRVRPQDCTGSVSFRVARLGGRFRVHFRDDHFRRISLRGAKVILYRERDLRCPRGADPRPRSCPQDLSFNAVDAEGGVAVGAFKTTEGRVDQAVVVARKSGDADAVHTITVTLAVPESFEASDDLATARIDGDAAAPWLAGDLSYVAPPASDGEDERCGPYRQSSGIATGDYTAFFDAVGAVTPAATGVPATLRRES